MRAWLNECGRRLRDREGSSSPSDEQLDSDAERFEAARLDTGVELELGVGTPEAELRVCLTAWAGEAEMYFFVAFPGDVGESVALAHFSNTGSVTEPVWKLDSIAWPEAGVRQPTEHEHSEVLRVVTEFSAQ